MALALDTTEIKTPRRRRTTTAVAKVTPQPVAPARTEAETIFALIERVSTDPSVSIERVEQTFAFYQKVQAEAARKAFAAALIAVQAEIEPVRKDADNPQTKSRYASFEALDRAIRPIYTKHGFAPTYRTEASDKPDHVRVVMTLMHKDGHERDYPADLPADGKGAKGGDVMTKTHAFGSAFSYGKRYTLGGAFNVVTTERDDDGNAAGGRVNDAITDEQEDALRDLIMDTQTDIHRFLAAARAECLSDVRKKDFPRLIAMLRAKKQRGAQ